MKVMLIVKANPDTEAGVMPGEELIAAMARYNEELVRAGVLLDAAGLTPSVRGARVHFSGGKVTTVDGPFTEARELIAGYWLIEVKSREEAIEWARRAPAPHGPDTDTHIEVRPLFGMEEFGESPAVEHHRRVGEAMARPRG
jgi:hypothetical protein